MIKLTFKKKTDFNFKHPSEGMHIAHVSGYLDPFDAETMKGDKYLASKYIFEVIDEWLDTTKKDKHLTCLSKTLRLDSLHPKSNLFALACAALGKKEVSESDLPTLDALVGKFVCVVISHNTITKDGVPKTYANVESVFACKNPPENFVSTYVKSNEKIATDEEIAEAIMEEKAEEMENSALGKQAKYDAEVLAKAFGTS